MVIKLNDLAKERRQQQSLLRSKSPNSANWSPSSVSHAQLGGQDVHFAFKAKHFDVDKQKQRRLRGEKKLKETNIQAVAKLVQQAQNRSRGSSRPPCEEIQLVPMINASIRLFNEYESEKLSQPNYDSSSHIVRPRTTCPFCRAFNKDFRMCKCKPRSPLRKSQKLSKPYRMGIEYQILPVIRESAHSRKLMKGRQQIKNTHQTWSAKNQSRNTF